MNEKTAPELLPVPFSLAACCLAGAAGPAGRPV